MSHLKDTQQKLFRHYFLLQRLVPPVKQVFLHGVRMRESKSGAMSTFGK
jgi:hypothetical protein